MIAVSLKGAGDIPAVSTISFSVRDVSCFSHLQMFLWHAQSLPLTNRAPWAKRRCKKLLCWGSGLLSPLCHFLNSLVFVFILFFFSSAKFYLGDFQGRPPWSSCTGAGTAYVCYYLSKMVKAKNSRHILGGENRNSFFLSFFSFSFSSLSPFLLLIPQVH